jgi:hypothetical protein
MTRNTCTLDVLAKLNEVRDYLSAISQIDKLTSVHADDRLTIAKKLGADGCHEIDAAIKMLRAAAEPEAKACALCGGLGWVTVTNRGPTSTVTSDQECPSCRCGKGCAPTPSGAGDL